MEGKISLGNDSYTAASAVDHWNSSDLVLLHQLLANRNVLSVAACDGMKRKNAVDFGL
jgi:hypothetical protein